MTDRPRLRPGAPLLRRDPTHLQVGTSPGIVIPDRPGLLPFLRLLDGIRDVERLEAIVAERIPELVGSVRSVVAELIGVGALSGASSSTVNNTFEVAIRPDADGAGLAAVTRSILTNSGLTRLDATEPDLLVLVSCGEPSRTVFEQASLWGLTHLPVVIDEDQVRIGPLVRPGLTPCVGCHDLHRADWDHAWPAIVHQLGRPGAVVDASGLAATTAHAAAVEVAAEVLEHAAGRRARTVGRCLMVGPRHDGRAVRPIPFHPRCACDLLKAA